MLGKSWLICSGCKGCWHEPLKYCPMCLAEMDKQESKLVKCRQRRAHEKTK